MLSASVKVVVSSVSGFCMGVKHAINLANEACGQCAGQVYVAGELVHNKKVMESIESIGIKLLGDDDLGKISPKDSLLIRAHGCPRNECVRFRKIFNTIIDGTCPHVVMVSKMVERGTVEGKYVIIIGDKSHPEVKTLVSFAKGGNVCVINSEEELGHLEGRMDQVLVIAQSTIDESVFLNFADKISKIYPHAEIKNTICGSSRRRQRAILDLKKEGAQTVIVVGGKHSNNTCTLVQIAQKIGLPTFHVETAADLPIEKLKVFQVIGVASGTSTDEKTTKQIIAVLRKLEN
ncbi:MAG: 4-hydroxy-3-methylbut-2-enyl diphosphate reductase [Puniceicoccales bacterium]|jgi:4-hydroxy-3-methylbut-2-enyl diphosphate reductase|nr:4-hydroxy-3-methylbut-2-enyl diphosphate reductase [Puniceicoccales bacterium]